MQPIRLGVILFLLAEANFFLLLIFAYIYFHHAGGPGPTAASVLDPVKTACFSAALFASSATVWRASINLRRGKRSRSALWLLATLALGSVFLVGQGTEYAHLLRRGITASSNLFGTTFFTLTGFHGLHVFSGLVMLAILFGLALARRPREPTHPALDGVSLYWHFVDSVWVVIFAVIYLWSFL